MSDLIDLSKLSFWVSRDGTIRFACKCPSLGFGAILCDVHATEIGKRLGEMLLKQGVIKQ